MNDEQEPKHKRQSDFPNVLVCIRECDMPGVGAWGVGDEVTDPDLIKKLTGHPYFDTKEGA
jgi:hypothetical protein